VFKLSSTTAFPTNIVPTAIPGVTDLLIRAMDNVFANFGNGPASANQPSGGNGQAVYQGAAGRVGTPQGTNSA
jgi:hypothetical protein